jgi:hypothetical protein
MGSQKKEEEEENIYSYLGDLDSELSRRFNDMTRVRKASHRVIFNLSALEYRHAVLGWCSYLIKPFVDPFDTLRYNDRFTIRNEDGEEYVCRVDDVKVFNDIFDTITPENYRVVWPDSLLLNIDQVRYKACLQVCNSRFRQHIKQHGLPPKVMLIRYSLYIDPKDPKT